MTVQSLDALSAYARAALRPGVGGADTAPATGGGAFATMVEQLVGNAADAARTSEATAAQSVQGSADLVDVVTAVNEAEMAMQTLVAVRDRVISAYQDIMRMPI